MVPHRLFVPLVAAAVLVCGGAAASEDKAHEEFRAAARQARDGDLQADWEKMLAARDRFAAFADHQELGALAHYYMGYADWRLSSLAFLALGQPGSKRLLDRAVGSLETSIQKRPAFPDAHALLAACLGISLSMDASQQEQVLPRMRAAWQAALPSLESNPRVMLLRAMALAFAPPPYGDRDKGFELWRRAIAKFETHRPEGLMPDWGDAEAVAWLGGAYLMLDRHHEAVEFLERALRMRPDFWWAGKAALPIARRPIPAK
jgi:tetratricopeptide (TPR) repeat protein